MIERFLFFRVYLGSADLYPHERLGVFCVCYCSYICRFSMNHVYDIFHPPFLFIIEPTDMRKSFDGLSGLVQHILDRNPFHGDVFLFINKRRDKIKLW